MIQVIVLAMLFFVGSNVEAQVCRRPTDVLGRTEDFSAEVYKKINLDSVTNNISEFCRRNLLIRFLKTVSNQEREKAGIRGDFELLSTPEIEQQTQLAADLKPNREIWQKTLIPVARIRESALDDVLKWIDINEQAPLYFSSPRPSEPIPVSQFNEIEKDPNLIAAARASDSKLATAACLTEMPLSPLECLKALELIKSRMLPRKKWNIMDMENWKRFFSSNKYDNGLRLAALKISKQVEGRLHPNSNIFDDLRSSFEESGLGPEESIEATWNTLGLISQGGANTIQRAALFSKGQKSAALGYIATAMNLLDSKKQGMGYKLYSYPDNIDTSCDNSKPYHFWMSGYLSRELIKSGISSDVAEKTVFLAQKGYQLNRDIAGKQLAVGKVLSKDPFDPVHQVIRTDLAYSAAGAIYGANSLKKTTQALNVDNAIISLARDASVVRPVDQKEYIGSIRSYLTWNKIFSPNSAYRELKFQNK